VSAPASVALVAKSPRRLPPLSAVASRIVEQTSQEEVDMTTLARLIEVDPALTIAVLRLVNSPFYGLSRKVGTVSDGMMVLGMNTLRRMAVAVAIAQPLQRLGIQRSLVEITWHKAIAGAVLAARLLDGHAEAQLAFTAGILQDLGRLELHLRSPASYTPLESLCGLDLCAAESEVFGEDHAHVGAELAHSWALPAVIVDAIAQHHQAAERAPTGAAAQAVWIASHVGDAALGLSLPPPLLHIRVDLAQAQSDSQRDVAALCGLLGL
jgi:putative nucleotidyltransferase with HDIG domain